MKCCGRTRSRGDKLPCSGVFYVFQLLLCTRQFPEAFQRSSRERLNIKNVPRCSKQSQVKKLYLRYCAGKQGVLPFLLRCGELRAFVVSTLSLLLRKSPLVSYGPWFSWLKEPLCSPCDRGERERCVRSAAPRCGALRKRNGDFSQRRGSQALPGRASGGSGPGGVAGERTLHNVKNSVCKKLPSSPGGETARELFVARLGGCLKVSSCPCVKQTLSPAVVFRCHRIIKLQVTLLSIVFIYVTVGLFLFGFVTQRNMFCSSWYLTCFFFAVCCSSCSLSRKWWFFVSNNAITTVTVNILPKRVHKAALRVGTLVKGAEPVLGSVLVSGLGLVLGSCTGPRLIPPSLWFSICPSQQSGLCSSEISPPLFQVVTFSGRSMRKEGGRKYAVLLAQSKENKGFCCCLRGSLGDSVACQPALSRHGFRLMRLPHLLLDLRLRGQNL